jgi:RNA methyltransferase, TrmH family
MRNKLTRELAVCGRNSVRRLCEVHPERIRRLFFRQALAPEFGAACSYLAGRRLVYRVAEDEDLERLAKSPHHGGAVAMIDYPAIGRADGSTTDRWAKEGAFVLALDGVANANNVGAIVRTMAFYGAHWLLLDEEAAQGLVTTSSYRVAEGGMEFVEILSVPSIPAFISETSRKVRYLGTDHGGAIPLKDLVFSSGGDRALAVVLGNEEHGLSRETRHACEGLVRIPGSGSIESLNVAQAACAILTQTFGRR